MIDASINIALLSSIFLKILKTEKKLWNVIIKNKINKSNSKYILLVGYSLIWRLHVPFRIPDPWHQKTVTSHVQNQPFDFQSRIYWKDWKNLSPQTEGAHTICHQHTTDHPCHQMELNVLTERVLISN